MKYFYVVGLLLLSFSAYALPSGSHVHSRPTTPPPRPNIYQMIAERTELSTSLQATTISAMIAANAGQTNIYNTALSEELADINTMIMSTHSAQNKANGKRSIDVGFLIDGIMIGAGVILVSDGVNNEQITLVGDKLIIRGTTSLVMMTNFGNQIHSILRNQLERQGVSPEVSNIVAQVLVGAGMVLISVEPAEADNMGVIFQNAAQS